MTADAPRRVRARRAVVKLGSQVLTRADGGGLDRAVFEGLARDVAELRSRGVEVVVVSSGAVAAGLARLGRTERPAAIPEVQALAAVGQINLVWLYKQVFGDQGLVVGQILLTRDDLENRRRYQNARDAVTALLRLGVVPVINENDSVVVDEIKFGDNDHLSAMVTNLVEADLLVLLTDTEGLYDRDPKTDPGARLLERVDEVDDAVASCVGDSVSRLGRGGMGSKVQAAKHATVGGAAAVIASGKQPRVLARVVDGEPVGTYFPPRADRLRRRKHWIAYTAQPQGRVFLDAGAVRAIVSGGKSLLPKGILQVEGAFERGEAVSLVGPDSVEIGRGLVRYNAAELRQVAGLASWEIVARLGYKFGDEAVHRDDLVVLSS